MGHLKSKEIARYVLQVYDTIEEPIKNAWFNNRKEAFSIFRDMVRKAIRVRYGEFELRKCSNQFIGYCAHYVYAHCVETYGINNN